MQLDGSFHDGGWQCRTIVRRGIHFLSSVSMRELNECKEILKHSKTDIKKNDWQQLMTVLKVYKFKKVGMFSLEENKIVWQ